MGTATLSQGPDENSAAATAGLDGHEGRCRPAAADAAADDDDAKGPQTSSPLALAAAAAA